MEDSAKLLANSTKHYTFISSIGVYQDLHQQNIDESYPVAKLENEQKEEITDKTYGALKAACEQVVQHYFPNQYLVIRPGLIVGPGDPTGRFSYWPLRVKEGGEILAPASPTQLLQFIDVRDLAKWIVTLVERQAIGIYNATGPTQPISFEQMLQACQSISNNKSSFTWVSEDFLIQNQVQDWTELPLWLSSKRKMSGLLNANIDQALQAGLTFCPLSDTLQAIITWDEKNKRGQIGLDPEKEKKLLVLWKQNKSASHSLSE